MSSPNTELSISDHIATITLCNPKRHNALGRDDVALFIEQLNEVANADDIRVLVLTNPEGKTFCAGAALDQIASGDLTSHQFAELPNKVAALTIPTVAAMNGSAFGGGVELALSCDFRIGIHHMKLHVPPAKIGLCYPISGIQRFVNVLGVTTAKRLLLCNEEFSAEMLLNSGFLTQLVERDQLTAVTDALAARIASLAPVAIATMKQICDDIAADNLDLAQASAMESACNSSADLKEGLAAVLERRSPVFRNC